MPPLSNKTLSTGKTYDQAAQELGFGGFDSIQKAILPAQATNFKLNVPDTFKSSDLTANVSTADVLARRREAEQEQLQKQSSQQQFQGILSQFGQGNLQGGTDLLSSFIFSRPETATTQQRDQLQAQATEQTGFLSGLFKGRGSQAERYQQLNEDPALVQARERLASTNEQLAKLQGDYSKFQADLENEAGQTVQGFESRLNPARRQFTAEYGAVAAVQQALQGNVQTAEKNIQTVLDLEFRDEQQQIDDAFQQLQLTQSQIANLEPELQVEAQQRATALEFALMQRSALADEQKSNRAQALQLAVQAGQNGAPQDVVSRMAQAQTPEDALALGSGFLKDPLLDLQKANLQADLRGQQLSNDKAYQELQQTNPATATTAQSLTNVIANSKIGAATKTNVGKALAVIKATEDLATARPDGEFEGYNPIKGILKYVTPSSIKSDETIKNEGYIDAINLQVQQWASGASLTEQQIKQVNKLVPDKNDTDRVVRNKLNNLVNYMNQQVSAQLASEGIDYAPEPVDLFAKDKSLDEIFTQ